MEELSPEWFQLLTTLQTTTAILAIASYARPDEIDLVSFWRYLDVCQSRLSSSSDGSFTADEREALLACVTVARDLCAGWPAEPITRFYDSLKESVDRMLERDRKMVSRICEREIEC